MKKKLLSALLIVAVLVASLAIFTACNTNDDGDKNITDYAIPSDLALNISIYNGDTLLGMLTKDDLTAVTQYRFTMTTVNNVDTEKTVTYIGYKLTDLIAAKNITVPAFTKIKSVASDEYTDEYNISSLANAYITIGYEENGAFAADSKGPRFVSDRTSGSSNSVAKYISRIIINPAAVPANTLTAIAAADNYDVPAFTIPVKNGADDIAVIDSATSFDGKTQYRYVMYESAASCKEYVGYKFADVLGSDVPSSITSVKAASTDNAITSIANSLILFAKYDSTGADITLNNSPRFVPDYAAANSTDDFVKNANTIIFNPIADPEPAATAEYSIALSWNETNLALTAVITDIAADKSNTVILSTAEGANTFANIEYKNQPNEDIDLGADKKISFEKTSKKGTTTYYGYDLKTILAAMQYKNRDGVIKNIIDETKYDFVGWTCSDDSAETDYTARSYTKTEISDNVISIVFNDSASVSEGQTRIFSDLSDTDPASYRNSSKYVMTLVLYKSDAAA